MPPHKGCTVSLRQWLQGLLQGSQRKESRRKTTIPTFTITLDAAITHHEIELVKTMPALTPRETEIVRLLRRGYSNKEIANELGIAVPTVKWNMTHILSKFEVESSRQLIALLAKLDEDNSRDWKILG